ncbi:MAG TPA: cytochrome D1 domain-containing protein [Pseudolabrys sp.]
MNESSARGLIAVDKMDGKVIFIDPATYEITAVLDDFARVPHELLVLPERSVAYVPIFGDGIHGRNPNPGHLLSIVDLATRTHAGDIDLLPYVSPHSLQLGPDGLLYITCENSGVVALVDLQKKTVTDAIETGSTNAHRLALAPDGRRLYTENEEDASISVIDVGARKLVKQIAMPHPLAGIAASPDGKLLVATDDEEPTIYLIDAVTLEIARSVRLDGVPEPGQIVRFSPDGALALVTSMRSGTATLIDPTFTRQSTVRVGKQPMDGAFRGGLLLIGCQGDGSIHVIDLAKQQAVTSFAAGVGCETLAFF